MSPTHECLVCAAAIRETHLGIEACRACALFYKRTRKTRRTYTCRRGTGKCVFRKHEPFACKKCRFDRCLAIGMEIAREKEEEEKKDELILDRVKKQYDESYKRRTEEERRLVVIHNLPRIENVNFPQELYKTSAYYYYATYPAMLKELINLLVVMLPEFDDFSDEIKFLIIRNLLTKFYAVDSYFRTSRNYLKTGLVHGTIFSCFDIDAANVETQWWNEHEENERKSDMKKFLGNHVRDYLAILHKMLRCDDITEREFHALIVIIFCELGATTELPELIQSLFDNLRSRMLQELQLYYKNRLKMTDYSMRICNLMSISTAVLEIHLISSKHLHLYSTLFDVKSEEKMINEAIAAHYH